jgi:hypothetical protein
MIRDDGDIGTVSGRRTTAPGTCGRSIETLLIGADVII